MSERHKRIHEVNTDFRAGETEDETVITIETSPALMPPAWVNFLKQRLHAAPSRLQACWGGANRRHVDAARR